MRRLIVNADDFGLTFGINRAILEAHQHGIVTSATLMANGAAFFDAAQVARTCARLSVGCHVVLVDGSPLLDPAQIPSLINNHQTSRHGAAFREGLTGFALRAARGRLAPEQIEAEVTAQVRKLQSAGISVSHVDTHKHTHIFPQVLGPLLRACQACGVRMIRNPFVPTARFALVAKRPRLWKRYGQVKIMSTLARKFHQAVRDAGMITTDGTVGIVATGAWDEKLFGLLFAVLPEGTWEFVCHPGYDDAELRGIRTRLRKSRERELRILTSPASRELLARREIELVSYRELACA